MDPLPLYRVVAPFVAVALFAAFCVWKPQPRFRVALAGILLMAGYGMLMDQVSARLCPEYFTVFHNPILGVSDPTLLGLLWGFLAAWWGGLFMGYAVGLTGTLGRNPPLSVRELTIGMAIVVAVTGVVSALCGASVYLHADLMGVRLDDRFADAVAPARHLGLFTVSCYHHLVAYATAILGSLVLCGWIARERHRRARLVAADAQPAAHPGLSSAGPG